MTTTKLLVIEFAEEDKIRGNYEIMISGPVKHIPNHRYLVSEDQVDILKQKGIKYTII